MIKRNYRADSLERECTELLIEEVAKAGISGLEFYGVTMKIENNRKGESKINM